MPSVGDVIVYGTQGVCKIDCIETKQIGKKTLQYYVLKPIFSDSTAVFVPVDNDQLVAKMQNVLTKGEAYELADSIPHIDVLTTNDEAEKRTLYKNILSSGDHKKLIALIKTVRAEREIRRQANKKLNINDEQTLRKAELLFYGELAFVYGVEPDEVKNIIKF